MLFLRKGGPFGDDDDDDHYMGARQKLGWPPVLFLYPDHGSANFWLFYLHSVLLTRIHTIMQLITIMTLPIALTQYVRMMSVSNLVDNDHDIGGHAVSAAHDDDDDGDNDNDL